MAVLRERARDAGVSVRSSSTPLLCFSFCPDPPLHVSQCPLRVCPELDDYQKQCGPLRLGLAGQHQRSNASLAIQLSHTWLQRRCPPGGPSGEGAASGAEPAGPPQAAPLTPSPVTLKGQCCTPPLLRLLRPRC